MVPAPKQHLSDEPQREPASAAPPLAGRELAGQIAVVTGSASGIGRAIGLELAAAGADCLVHAKENRTGAESVAAEIRRLGRTAEVMLADLADTAAARFVRRARLEMARAH